MLTEKSESVETVDVGRARAVAALVAAEREMERLTLGNGENGGGLCLATRFAVRQLIHELQASHTRETQLVSERAADLLSESPAGQVYDEFWRLPDGRQLGDPGRGDTLETLVYEAMKGVRVAAHHAADVDESAAIPY